MKLFFSHLLVFAAGLAVGAAVIWMGGRTKSAAGLLVPTAAVASADGVAFGELGLRSGDILKSVNGDSSPEMMRELASGHDRGQVCVIFERTGRDREICLKERRTASAH